VATEKVTVRVPVEVVEAMRGMAQAHDRSMAREITFALRQYLAELAGRGAGTQRMRGTERDLT